MYGIGEWAAGYAPDLLGLTPQQLEGLNDDGVGRALAALFRSELPAFVLSLVRHTIREFAVTLSQLHNDSTTITFHGNYAQAAEEGSRGGRPTAAITWGHNKDHRPDLKQLLYILTISDDGGVPVHFRVQSGNTTDDRTHQETWELLCELAGRRDFLYVADCKLATAENMAYLHQRGGRFLTVLPKTRGEDQAFREVLRRGQVAWRTIHEKTDEEQPEKVLDRFSAAQAPAVSAEGYRLLWFHSTRKAELDAAARAGHIQRATRQLDDLAAAAHLAADPLPPAGQGGRRGGGDPPLLPGRRLGPRPDRGADRGALSPGPQRPAGQGHPLRQGGVHAIRPELSGGPRRIAEDQRCDGVFPLVTNVLDLSEVELLLAYKRQPVIEKRFSQLKTDFRVAPVYLKEVSRIQALLGVYFLVLLVEALLERELRQAMERKGLDSLPMYPEDRPCRRPTTRRLIDLFDDIQRHTLDDGRHAPVVFVSELSRLQRRILKLLGVPATEYQG